MDHLYKHFAGWTCRCSSANRPSIFACRSSKKSRRSQSQEQGRRHMIKLTPNAQHSWKCEEIFGRKSNWNRFCTNEIASSAASFDPIGPAAPQLIQPCFTWDILRHLETSSNIHISLTRSTKPTAKEAKNTGTDLAIRPWGAASAEKNCCPLSHLWDFLVPCQVLNPTSSNALAKVTLKPTHFWPKNAAVIMLHQEESTSSRQLALGILQWCLSFERFVLDCWDSLLNYLVISLCTLVHWRPWQSLHGLWQLTDSQCSAWWEANLHFQLAWLYVLKAFSNHHGQLHTAMDDLVKGDLHPAQKVCSLHHIFIPNL